MPSPLMPAEDLVSLCRLVVIEITYSMQLNFKYAVWDASQPKGSAVHPQNLGQTFSLASLADDDIQIHDTQQRQ